jgi:hypothetical protein
VHSEIQVDTPPATDIQAVVMPVGDAAAQGLVPEVPAPEAKSKKKNKKKKGGKKEAPKVKTDPLPAPRRRRSVAAVKRANIVANRLPKLVPLRSRSNSFDDI